MDSQGNMNNPCSDGYTKGWDKTCALALKDPNAEHDIYGCPGISDQIINKLLDADNARYRATLAIL